MAAYANKPGGRMSFMTVGRALPGMQDVSRNASSNVKMTPKTIDLIEEASTQNGCIKIEIKDMALQGSKLFRIKVDSRPWEEKMDALAQKVDTERPCVFLLFRDHGDLMVIKYIPDKCQTKLRMLYAASMGSLKQEILTILPNMRMEEYNVSEASELDHNEYNKQKNIEAPLTEAEIQAREEAAMPTAGGYSLLAQLGGAGGIRLPGMGTKKVPERYLRAPSADDKYDDDDDAQVENGDDNDEEESTSEDEVEQEKEPSSGDGGKKRMSIVQQRKSMLEKNERKSSARHSAVSRSSSARNSSARKSSTSRASTKRMSSMSSVSRKSSRSPSKRDNTLAEEDEEDAYPYTLKDLVKMKSLGEFDEGMDTSKLEIYLANAEFKKTFEMSKKEFTLLPGWKQTMLKKSAKLF